MPSSIIPPFYIERRRRYTRRYFNGGIANLPIGGTRTAGATQTLSNLGLQLDSVTPGANRVNQVGELTGLDPHIFSIAGGLNAPWSIAHYISAYIRLTPGGFVNPTATQFVGFMLLGQNFSAPPAVPPATQTGDQMLWAVARATDGRWSVFQDDSTNSFENVLTGVTAFDTAGNDASRFEMFYDPNGTITVAINGVVGITLSGSNFKLDNSATSCHVLASVFTTTGSNAAGRTICIVYDMLVDSFMVI